MGRQRPTSSRRRCTWQPTAAIALRFLYTEALTGKREMVNQVLTISLEELSETMVSLLAHGLPSAAADRLSLLGQVAELPLAQSQVRALEITWLARRRPGLMFGGANRPGPAAAPRERHLRLADLAAACWGTAKKPAWSRPRMILHLEKARGEGPQPSGARSVGGRISPRLRHWRRAEVDSRNRRPSALESHTRSHHRCFRLGGGARAHVVHASERLGHAEHAFWQVGSPSFLNTHTVVACGKVRPFLFRLAVETEVQREVRSGI